MKHWRDLSSAQKKYIELSVMMLGFLVLTFGFYIPSLKDANLVKAEYKEVTADIGRIELLAGKDGDIREGLQGLKEEIAAFDRRFPGKEERGLKVIADSARKNSLEIVSTRMGIRRDAVDEKNKPLQLQGRKCYLIPVSLQLQGLYQNVVPYLTELNNNPDYFVTLERLNLDRAAGGDGLLTIALDLNLYILI